VKSALTVVATPATITPNGDGINDEVHIVYDVVEIIGVVPVTVEIRDLAGRRVQQLHTGDERIGHYQFEWDGRFEDGRLVPPGIYLFRVTTEIDDDQFARIGTLRVLY
jgi:flagellar hook assembly protein FlgD